jgi:formylglycine-generating enzyme required for sulfatase activity
MTEEEFAPVLADYLSWVMREHGLARLHGLQALQGSGPISKPLSAVYTSLVAYRRMAEVPPAASSSRRANLRKQVGQQETTEGRAEPQPLDMADILTVKDRVAIIGRAGSGKTTYLSFVAAGLAEALTGQPLDTRLKPGREGPLPVPLLAPLRFWKVYRDACAQEPKRLLDQPEAGTLAGFLLWYLRYRYKDFAAAGDFFERLLKGGGCLIMLDGLDEVVSVEERRVVRDAVGRLLDTQYPGNQCLVTAREAGYRDAPFGDDFVRCDVQPMTDEQIKALVEAWCAQIWPQSQDCQAACGELLQAINSLNRERVKRRQEPLVTTPLLVTMVVSVKYSRRELPRERAKLYDACVDVILDSQYTGAEDEAGARRIVVDWGGPPAKQREWLSRLAFEMHQGGEAGATAEETWVRDVLSPLLTQRGELPLLDRFLDAVRGRGGLFDYRGGRFQFMHLTFQEFLAAQYLARRWTALQDPAAFLAQRVVDEWWREVMLLTIGSLGAPAPYEQREAFVTALWQLTDSPQAEVAAAELAGSGLLDLTEPEPKLLDLARDRLAALLSNPGLTGVQPATRATAGRALAGLQDPRPGVRLRPDGLPDIVWCEVPAGPFLMGSDKKKKDPQAWDDELPEHMEQSIVQPYLISRYPVTNGQFGAFVQDGGYTDPRWLKTCWTEAGKRWLKANNITGPERYGGAFDLDNHPIVGISWYEALAFCRWLTERLPGSDCQLHIWRNGEAHPLNVEPGSLDVRLPTEPEWERAARSTDGRIYPWEGDFDPTKCNSDESGIGSTSAVGIFPQGDSTCGCADMAGNVWEWCSTQWAENYKGYDKGVKEREDPEGEGPRVLRGGSWGSYRRLVRCASRWLYPRGRRWYFGFRVVVGASGSPPL